MSDNDSTIRITLRIPADLHEKLVKAASEDNRSMNAEIIQRLEKSLDPNQLKTPGKWGSISQDGQISFKGPQEMLDELQELTTRTQSIINIFQIAQKEAEEIDLSNPPDFPFTDSDDQ